MPNAFCYFMNDKSFRYPDLFFSISFMNIICPFVCIKYFSRTHFFLKQDYACKNRSTFGHKNVFTKKLKQTLFIIMYEILSLIRPETILLSGGTTANST